jgi:hypothetical protein
VDVLRRAVGCTVTRVEHERLSAIGSVDGWQRYLDAGVRVFDARPTTAAEPMEVDLTCLR